MNDTLRYVLAGILIFLIIILQPFYLDWLGYDASDGFETQISGPLPDSTLALVKKDFTEHSSFNNKSFVSSSIKESFVTISTPIYTATITNRSGGSFVDYEIKDENTGKLKYFGGYDNVGAFQSDLPVSLIMPSEHRCMPCLAHYNDRAEQYIFINELFVLSNPPVAHTIFLDFDDSINTRNNCAQIFFLYIIAFEHIQHRI